MASITVNATGYWGDDSILTSGSWAGLVRGNTVTITLGAVLTLDASVRTPTNYSVSLNIVCINQFSKFIIRNTSTTTPVTFYGPSGGSFRFESKCSTECYGGWIVLYTGNGNANQTTTGYTASGFSYLDEIGGIWVETGNGTDVWERWMNVGSASLSTIGVGFLGRFFSYNPANGVLSFGNGGNPTLLTSNASLGDTVIYVQSASNFTANNYLHIFDSTDRNMETVEVLSISGNAITLKTALERSYTVANTGTVRLTTGGKTIPAGAIVRVPNILIGCKDASGNITTPTTEAACYQLDTDSGGIVIWDTVMVTGFFTNIRNAASTVISHFSHKHRFINQYGIDAVYTDLVSGVNRDLPSTACFYLDYTQSNNLYDSDFATTSGNGTITIVNSDNVFIKNTFIEITQRASTSASTLSCTSLNSTLENVFLVGATAVLNAYEKLSAKDVYFSDSPNGVPQALYFNNSIAVKSSDSMIDGVYDIKEGCQQNSSTTAIISECRYVKRANFRLRSGYFYTPPGGTTGKFVDSYVYGTGTPVQWVSRSRVFMYQNVACLNYNSGFYQNTSGLLIKGSQHNTRLITLSSVFAVNCGFYELWLNAVQNGCCGILFNPFNAAYPYITVSNSGDISILYGSLSIVNNNGWIEYTWPHYMVGILSYPSAGTLEIAGTNPSNFTIEYQIDTGTSWSAWRTMYSGGTFYAATMAAENITVGTWHKLKVRISKATGSLTDNLTRLNWSANTDYVNYKYPYFEVNVTLQNVKDGSAYYVYNESTGKVISRGVQSGYNDILIVQVPYSGVAETLLIRVRKSSENPKYLPFETRAILTDNGASAWIEQALDRVIA